MARHTLSAEVNFDDLSVIGISCHQKIYRLCWAMNKMLGFSLVKTEDYIIDKESKQQVFIRYEYLQAKTELRYSLIENKGTELSKKKLMIEKQTGKKTFYLCLK